LTGSRSAPGPAYQRALELTQGHHASQNKTFSGQFTWKQRHRIKEVIDRFAVASILDYGCGQGKQYDPARNRDETGRSLEQFWGVGATKYDPGVPVYAAEPRGKFDLVLCVQVLASIPRDSLPWVIDRLYGYAGKAIFVAERIGAPHKRIYQSIAPEMPHGIGVDEWLALLRRPGDPVRLIAAFHKRDERKGWRIEEPLDQGPR
jgi:hypothetical protein